MSNRPITILVAEDDPGHAALIRKNLARAGIGNPIQHFSDGQRALDFLFRKDGQSQRLTPGEYILLLDIRMPKVDGVEVLQQVKADDALKTLPVVMLTTTDDPREVDRCYRLGCSTYITKPVEHQAFVEAIQRLGLFLEIVKSPHIDVDPKGR